MPLIDTHPTVGEIEAFALGRSNAPADSVVEEHIAGCDCCQQKAEAVAPDTIIELLVAARTRIDFRHSEAPTLTLDGSATPSLHPATHAWGDAVGSDANLDAPDVLANHPKYRAVRRLGVGGMGTVWLAQHEVMHRQVAVKVIRRDLLARPGAAGRFLREVRAAAKLDHPNIVRAYDAEQAGDSCLLAMEYVEGKTLADMVMTGPMPATEACRAIRDAARGLAHAHAAGIVHRDVKPHNLMRATDGTVKVLDFGLTGVGAGESVAADGDGLTGAGMVVGTPDYIAPEQISDPHAADARADIYGLGCTFYHLLTGRSPVPDGTIAQKLMAQESRTPDPIPDLPRGLADVLAKMLAKRPEDRYQSAEELLAALEPFLNAERKTRNAEPKTWGEKLTRWILAASLLFVGVAFIVKYYRDNEVITITTDDPDIEVVMKRKGEIVLIRDTKTGQTWEYDTIKDQFGLADQADGLKLGLPEKGEFVLWRKGERVFSVARTARPAAQSEASWVPLFNGKDLTNWAAVGAGTWTVEQGILRGTKDRLATTREYSHFDLRTEFKLHEKEPCVLQIGEGQQHLLVILTRTPRGLHAILTSGDPADKSSRTATGTIAAPAVDRFLTLRLLIDDQRVKLELDNEAVAELPRGAVPLTTGKILLSTGTEFRKIEIKELALTPVNSDKELILGSWRATSVEIDGVVMPQMVLDMMQPTLAFAPDKVTSKAEGPNAKGFLEFAKNMGLLTNEKDGAFVALNGGEGIYHLDPAKSPRTIDITTLGTVRKSALGLYSLDGDTLKLCLSIDPQKVSERPKEFSSRNGEKRVIVTLRRLAGAELPGSPRGMFALPTPAQGAAWALTLDGKGKFSIARDGKLSSEGTYKITGDQIEFTDEAGPFAETGDKRTGTYRWKLAGWAVLFTPVKDEARGRMSILVSGAWVKTPESVVTPPKP